MDIIKEINKYIKLSEEKAKQEETKLINKMQKYLIEEQEVCFEDTLIMKYFLMYLRQEKKLLESDTWEYIIDGTSIHEGFIDFLIDNELWTDYTAQLLCITDKDNIDWSKKEQVLDGEWLEEDLYQNMELNKEFIKGILFEEIKKEPSIIYEWDHLKDSKEWKQTDISNVKSRDGLSGIKLMKYLDSTLTKEFIIDRIKKCLREKKLFYDFEIYLDENEFPRIRIGESVLNLKAKQYLDFERFYLFKEDETKKPTQSKKLIDLDSLPKINYKFLTPIDLDVVVIHKEANIKKLVIKTLEGYTVHLLYDELPHQLLRDCYKYSLIGLNNEIQKTLKKSVLVNYKVYAEFEHDSNSIQKTPFLVENKNTESEHALYSTPEYKRYLKRHVRYDLIPDVTQLVYRIDEIQFSKTNKCTHLKTNLTKQEHKEFVKVEDGPNLAMFGDLLINDDSFVIEANDLLSALAYNAICYANGTNNVFELIKEYNDIKLIIWTPESDNPSLKDLKVVTYNYIPKK